MTRFYTVALKLASEQYWREDRSFIRLGVSSEGGAERVAGQVS